MRVAQKQLETGLAVKSTLPAFQAALREIAVLVPFARVVIEVRLTCLHYNKPNLIKMTDRPIVRKCGLM